MDKLHKYIESVEWRFAKTYADKSPHWYTVKKWNPDKEAAFEELVKFIRENGYEIMYFSTPFTVCHIGDYYYWTMDELVQDTDLINRALLVDGQPPKYSDPSSVPTPPKQNL